MPRFHTCYGDCEGPLGFPMKGEVARALEGVLKGLPADCKRLVEASGGPLRRARVPAKVELAPGERADISLVTTEAVDLDREVILADGVDWSYFGKNGGRVTWAHQYNLLDVGRCLWMKREGNGWLAKTVYHERPGEDVLPKGQPWFPDVVNYYVQELGLKGKSIGFVPLEARQPTAEEVKGRPEFAEVRWVFPRVLGLEYAVTPVQANPDAVVQMVSKARRAGVETPDVMMKSFGVIVPGFGGEEVRPERKSGDARRPVYPSEIRDAVRRALDEVDVAAMVRDVIAGIRGRL